MAHCLPSVRGDSRRTRPTSSDTGTPSNARGEIGWKKKERVSGGDTGVGCDSSQLSEKRELKCRGAGSGETRGWKTRRLSKNAARPVSGHISRRRR